MDKDKYKDREKQYLNPNLFMQLDQLFAPIQTFNHFKFAPLPGIYSGVHQAVFNAFFMSHFGASGAEIPPILYVILYSILVIYVGVQ